MTTPTTPQDFIYQLTTKGLEALTVWNEAQQRVLRELVELSAAGAREGLRIYGDLTRSSLAAMREGREAGVRWQAAVEQAGRNVQETLTEAISKLTTLCASAA
jgi:DNA-binding PadR family transcriptional regulator